MIGLIVRKEQVVMNWLSESVLPSKMSQAVFYKLLPIRMKGAQ
jgi:hypothetical protein